MQTTKNLNNAVRFRLDKWRCDFICSLISTPFITESHDEYHCIVHFDFLRNGFGRKY